MPRLETSFYPLRQGKKKRERERKSDSGSYISYLEMIHATSAHTLLAKS